MTTEEAIKASRNGAYAAFVSGTATTALVVFAIWTNNQEAFAIWNDSVNFFDIFIIFACAVGMLRQSRAAAVLIFVYFIFAKISIAIETGATGGLGIGLLFLYFFAKAIQGSFTYHKICKAEDPDYRPAPKWAYYVGIPATLLLVSLAGLGLLSMTDAIPSVEVLPGAEVSKSDVDLLVANEVLFPDEKIEYFYSYGLVSVLEGGNILTDRAVITYYVDDADELQIYEMKFEDITAVYRLEEGGMFLDSIYKVTSADEDFWMTIELSAESQGDVIFVEALRKKVQLAKAAAEKSADEGTGGP